MSEAKPEIRVRMHVERMRLLSVNPDNTLKYPGVTELTWLGVPHMPLVLAKMEPAS
ncbi:hypothetical protein ACRQ5Q_14885 [Bradyrhizobium sp. PMVTL-01]|uniref:hypothetical protein n=1 Tax=Bradyrhizobium sp. PMVTL-01 TaxID=3434999 RepID=UPI003F70F0A7